MLSADHDSVDTDGDGSSVVELVLDGDLFRIQRQDRYHKSPDLGLGVGAQPSENTVAAELRHLGVQLVRQQAGEGHGLRGLVGSISEHDTLDAIGNATVSQMQPNLVTSTDFLLVDSASGLLNSLRNIGAVKRKIPSQFRRHPSNLCCSMAIRTLQVL